LNLSALCTALLLTLTAHAGVAARAPLTGQHTSGYLDGAPLLICEYAGERAKFEILSQNGKCAPFIQVQ
jgi:hypothetical protein